MRAGISTIVRSPSRYADTDGDGIATRTLPGVGGKGAYYLEEDRVDGENPLAPFPPTAARHLLRTHRFAHAPDVLVGSFYDPALDEGCAFEELISFHGGLGGPQTRPFLLYPASLPFPDEPIMGAAAVNELLRGWRAHLQPASSG